MPASSPTSLVWSRICRPDSNEHGLVKQVLLFVALADALCGPLAAAGKIAPPNILFVIADQWRAQAFGFAGDPNVKTPHLDLFERQCIHFTQAVAGMPVCSPTRASLLTGQRPQTHGVFLNDVPLSLNAVTLPKELKAAGYDTGCIGKWHIDGHGSRSAFIPRERRQGFDYWKVLECTHAYHESAYYADGLQVGRDNNGAVGPYAAPFPYEGRIRSVRLDLQ